MYNTISDDSRSMASTSQDAELWEELPAEVIEPPWEEVGSKAKARKAKQAEARSSSGGNENGAAQSSKAGGKKPMKDEGDKGSEGSSCSTSILSEGGAAANGTSSSSSSHPDGHQGGNGSSAQRNSGATAAVAAPSPTHPSKKGKRKASVSTSKGTDESSGAASSSSTSSGGSNGGTSARGFGAASQGTLAPAPLQQPPPSLGTPTSESRPSPTAKKKDVKRELTKSELQAKCEALVASESAELGWLTIVDLERALCSSLEAVPSWESKYRPAHGLLRTFLQRCPNLSVATVDGTDRVYLSRALDATARAAIAAEKAERQKLASPAVKRRKGRGTRGRLAWLASVLRLSPRLLLVLWCSRLAACALGLPYLGCDDLNTCDVPPPGGTWIGTQISQLSFGCLRAASSASELQDQCLRAWLPLSLDMHDAAAVHFGPTFRRAIGTPGCSPPTFTLLRYVGATLVATCVALLLSPRVGTFLCLLVFMIMVYANYTAELGVSLYLGGVALVSGMAAIQVHLFQ